MPLQGVWTADGGGLPPWRGDYHNDLNTQMTYVAFHAAGLVESGMAYLNFYWDRLPQFRRYGSAFFGTDGAMVPGVMTLGGRAMGGWIQYSHLVCAGLWNGHAFYQHWKVTRDDEFLAERAYPWLSEVAASVFSLTREEDGHLVLPVSCSPEWNNDKWTAFLKPNSNFDQSLLLWAAEALEEMATALNRPAEARKWASLHARLAPLKHHEKTGALLISEGVSYGGGHRHFSHALAIHPLSILHVDQSEEARRAVRATVRQIIDGRRRGWVGYSFSSAAGLAARAGFADDAERLLVDFERAFVTRNGFHVNGDQSWTILPGQRRRGSRAFTLEGNFLFMDAIHEMYMQSFGDMVRIFPAVPESWRDAAFTDLRAEGGFIVSARRAGGLTREVEVRARRDATLRLPDPFPGREATWSRPPEREDDCLLFDLRAGETLTGSAAP
jgi:alpha-L-fucosidase 2